MFCEKGGIQTSTASAAVPRPAVRTDREGDIPDARAWPHKIGSERYPTFAERAPIPAEKGPQHQQTYEEGPLPRPASLGAATAPSTG